MSQPFQTPPKSICILRLSAIGDVTHIIPIIRTLQFVWPQCRITWIIGKTEATLVNELENVEFIIFDKSAGFKAFAQLRKQLKYRNFDVMLHMQASLRANIISTLIKSPYKAGFDKARAINGQSFFTNHKIAAQPKQHVLESFFEFLKLIGINKAMLEWKIPVPVDDELWAAKQLAHCQKILVINPCSSNRARNWRNWSSSQYAAIINYAVQKYAASIVLSGGPDPKERKITEEIQHKTAFKTINLTGKTSLKKLMAVLSQATAVIAPDTGPAHMATAAGVPVIGLYASSNPLRTGPYLSLEHCVNKYPQALEKYLHKSIDDVRWGQRVRSSEVMDLITVDEVIEKLDAIFAEEPTIELTGY